MIQLKNYTIENKIYNGENSRIYRANKNGTPIIIKALQKEYPVPKEIKLFLEEYEILKNIKAKGVTETIGIEKYANSFVILFKDIGAESLHFLFDEIRKLSLEKLIDIMLKCIKSLEEINKLEYVHRDIKPHNIVLNMKTGELQIIDFGSASKLSKQQSFISLNSSLEGTLAYISPEQTGRMNRTVDYRTDYYSLGITFYQLVTGELPFTSIDPMELVHSHIAKIPISPLERNKTPKVLSEIIMKLIQKKPEDRYQSISGILYDLEWYKKSLEILESESGKEYILSHQMAKFIIGQNDFSAKFQIPEKLYGRTKEELQIIKTFKLVTGGNKELTLISGSSGIGKSALVNEINKPIIEYKGYFTSGKYDQFKRSIPYRAITYALQNLIQQILTENSLSISVWKEQIVSALGTNGKLIIDVIPELESLIGEQPAVVELGAAESQNRFHLVFQNFIKAFCKREHPIAIFLDDLQWADISSISLIHSILSDPNLKYLYLILSFRDNEVLPTSAFSLMLEELSSKGFHYNEISLEPISLSEITRLVSDTLGCEKSRAMELAEILFEKTHGNPFFVNEAFKSFYENGLIEYRAGNWVWEIEKVREAKLTKNVIDLMVSKIRNLPDKAIKNLKLAACIGSWFKQEVYAKISGQDEATAKNELTQIANEGCLRLGETDVNFVHDKIREATYSLISEEEKVNYHYAIGNAYLSMLDEYKLEDHVFTIVNQLNQAISLITNKEEINRLQELNILAGNKAMSSNAYESALIFFRIAISFLSETAWVDNYNLTLSLFTNLAKSEYLSKEYESAEKTFALVLERAKNANDKVLIYDLQSSMYASQNKMLKAIQVLKEAIKSLGMKLPNKPTELSPLPEIIKFKLKIGKRKPNDLLNLPEMKDSNSLAIMHLLNALIAPSFIAEPKLFPVIVLKMVNLSLKYGNSPLSAFGYGCFGIIQGSGLGDFYKGFEFGKLAIDLLDILKGKSQAIECRTNFMFVTMVYHWRQHAKKGKLFYDHAFEKGIESGDLQYTSYALNNLHFQRILMRQNLFEISESFRKYESIFSNLKQYNAEQLCLLNRQIISNLQGEAEDVLMLIGKYFDETKVLPEWIETKNANALFDFYLCKSRLEYFFGNTKKALDYSSLTASYESAMFGMMFVPEHVFFDSLICAKLFLESNEQKKQKEFKKRITNNFKRMKKWGENCEANYGHKAKIIEALLFQIEGNIDKALSSFEQAIHLAKEHEYTLEEALANEFSAEIWLARGKEQYANTHLIEAHYLYRKWGCEPKVKQLEEKYPQLKQYMTQSIYSINAPASIPSSTLTTNSENNFLDLATVVKASQAISSEIQLGSLLEKMMKILLENAGAEKGFFILKNKDNWSIEAEGNVNTEKIEVLQHETLTDYAELSPNIVAYVARTKSIVLLDDATKKGMFVNDSYVKTKKPKSVLSYPILNQGNLVGVVYLENNRTTNAFTPDRIEILKILSSQIAVSIENSLLYSNLEEKVALRTNDLNQALNLIKQDMALAKKIQRNSMQYPYKLIEELEIIPIYIPMSEVGGDFYGISKLNDSIYRIFIADATGHGVQAALITMAIKGIYDNLKYFDYEISEIMSLFNNEFFNKYVTLNSLMTCAIIDINVRNHFIKYVSAGNPGLVCIKNNKTEILEKTGMMVGVKKDVQYKSVQVPFSPGDRLYIFTDGIFEEFNSKEEEFGEERLHTILKENNILSIQNTIDVVLKNLDVFIENTERQDDITILGIEFKG